MTNFINEMKEIIVNNFELVTGRDLNGRDLKDISNAIEDINQSFEIFEERFGRLHEESNIEIPYIKILRIKLWYGGKIQIDTSWSNQEVTSEWLEIVIKIKNIADKYSK